MPNVVLLAAESFLEKLLYCQTVWSVQDNGKEEFNEMDS